MDKTPSMRAHGKLTPSEEMASFAEFNPAPVLRVSEDGIIVQSNPALVTELGGEDPVGKRWLDVCPNMKQEDMDRLFRDGGQFQQESKLGSGEYLFTCIRVGESEGDRSIHIYGADISSVKKMERKLKKAMRHRDEFLANMSHELRTPLNAILGMTEAMREGVYGPVTERQVVPLERVADSGSFLLQLISDILDLSQFASGTLELAVQQTSLREVCMVAVQLVQKEADQKGIQIRSDCGSSTSLMEGDPARLKQIVFNLLDNAVKFTPENGEVGLILTDDPSGKQTQLTVWDTGIGIDLDDYDQLFQPFVQLDSRLDRRFEGTGLGLALVDRLVRLHGGSVDVESEVDKGTRFTIRMPVQQRADAI